VSVGTDHITLRATEGELYTAGMTFGDWTTEG
jgi:hypothetical protein